MGQSYLWVNGIAENIKKSSCGFSIKSKLSILTFYCLCIHKSVNKGEIECVKSRHRKPSLKKFTIYTFIHNSVEIRVHR